MSDPLLVWSNGNESDGGGEPCDLNDLIPVLGLPRPVIGVVFAGGSGTFFPPSPEEEK